MFDTKIHCVIASTGCGKTIFLKDLLRRYVVEDNIFKFGFIFAANINDFNEYNNVYDYTNIDEKLKNILRYKEKYKEKPMYIVFDDASANLDLSSKKIKKSVIYKYFTMHRHINCTIFLVLHHCKVMEPLIRNSIKYLYLSKFTSTDAIKGCYNLTYGFYDSEKEFLNDVMKLEKYTFIIYDILELKKEYRKVDISKKNIIEYCY